MGNPYAAKFTDEEGEVRLEGELDFTDAANQPGTIPLTGWTEDSADPGNVTSNGDNTDTNGTLVVGKRTGTDQAVFLGANTSQWTNADGTQTLGVTNAATSATSALGFYNTEPVVQPAAIAAPAGGATVDAQARAAIVSILNAIGAGAGGIGITK